VVTVATKKTKKGAKKPNDRLALITTAIVNLDAAVRESVRRQRPYLATLLRALPPLYQMRPCVAA
jgi:hypothetical protein